MRTSSRLYVAVGPQLSEASTTAYPSGSSQPKWRATTGATLFFRMSLVKQAFGHPAGYLLRTARGHSPSAHAKWHSGVRSDDVALNVAELSRAVLTRLIARTYYVPMFDGLPFILHVTTDLGKSLERLLAPA